MTPMLKSVLGQFAPDLITQLEDSVRAQIAFSEALTPEQQIAMRNAIKRGPETFIAWSRTDAGTAAIREVVSKFIGEQK